jgi:hypothetical protein
VFLSSYGVLGAKALVLEAHGHTVTLSFDRWEFPALEVESKVTLSFVFSNSSGSVLYSPAVVMRRKMESDSVVFDIEVGHDDLAANSALARLQRLLHENEDENGNEDDGALRVAEH